jgi:hypothetical protein
MNKTFKKNTRRVPFVVNPRNDNNNRGRAHLWEIYPDYWKKTWGELPLLGIVAADSEFDAIRAAYDAKLLPYNFTFGPKPVLRKKRSLDEPEKEIR